MNQIEVIEQIQTDFTERNEPFDDIEFPEERLLRDAGTVKDKIRHNKLKLLTIFCTFDYNRDANQLADNLIELHDIDPMVLNPYYVVDKLSEDRLQSTFEQIGFRYPSRDAHGWYENCEILKEKYNGDVRNIILDVGCDAEKFVERLNKDGFLYLKGSKIAPMYARFINDYVAPLDNLWKLDIPTDTHIIRLTEDLTGTTMDAKDVRSWWRNIGEENDIERHVVDGALWQVGNQWDNWGEDYWNEVNSGGN